MKGEKRSPLKDKPLRNPGQSLDDKLQDLAYEGIVAPIFMAVVLVGPAASAPTLIVNPERLGILHEATGGER